MLLLLLLFLFLKMAAMALENNNFREIFFNRMFDLKRLELSRFLSNFRFYISFQIFSPNRSPILGSNEPLARALKPGPERWVGLRLLSLKMGSQRMRLTHGPDLIRAQECEIQSY